MKFISTLLLVLNVLVVQAQNFNKAKLDSLFTLIETNNKGWGSVSIFKEGKEIYTRSTGYANLKDSIPATKETKYHIGSISKTFTAAMIMKLIENGKLSLETKLYEFFPGINNAKKITIKHLLQHRSGIYNYTNSKDFENYFNKNTSRKKFLETIKKLGSVFKPDEKFEYSNSNYVLLSWIIEDITKKSYSVALEKFITKPLQLKKTFLPDEISENNNGATSYIYNNNYEKQQNWHPNIVLGAGGIVSTPTELNVFITKLLKGEIVSKNLVDAMLTIQNSYGFGIIQVPFGKKKGYGHTGGLAGYRSALYNFYDDKVTVAYTANCEILPVNDIIIYCLNTAFNIDFKLPAFKNYKVNSKDIDQYLGIYAKRNFPIKITITKKGDKLICQGTNQPQFNLEPYEIHKFKIDVVRAKFEFIPNENKLILFQGGQVIEMVKE